MPDDSSEASEDSREMIAWVNGLIDQVPQHAEKWGVTEKRLRELKKVREELRDKRYATVLKRMDVSRQRLLQRCPKALEMPLFRDVFSRVLIIKEPKRSEMLDLLESWITGIERQQGNELVAGLSSGYWKEGVQLFPTIPEGCGQMSYYARLRGRAPWRFFATTIGKTHLFSTKLEDSCVDDWFLPGDTMQFVAFGSLDWKPIGLPSDIIDVEVPSEYPIADARPVGSAA